MKKKYLGIIVSTLIAIIILLLLGPLDVFTHGYFSNEVDVEQIAAEDILGNINAIDEKCVIEFSPQRNHFTGFELFFVEHAPENGGILTVHIYNSDMDKKLEEIEIDLESVKAFEWYKVYTNAPYRKDGQYAIKFTVSDTDNVPSFMLVNDDYLPDELISNNTLINFAYSQSTFSFQEKIIFSVLILAIWGLILHYFLPDKKIKNYFKNISFFLILTMGLTWNYMYNSMDTQNNGFLGFQLDSECLVSGRIYAEYDGITPGKYGLGRYFDLKGNMIDYSSGYLTDDNWLDGYGRSMPAIIINSNYFTKKIAVAGNFVQFENGEEYQITEITDDGSTIAINLNAERTLSQARNGSLDEAVFLDINQQPLPVGKLRPYISQFGLQGKVFGHMAYFLDEEEAISTLNLICSISTAVVFVLIVILISKNYNIVLAGCFYLTFLLSPWVVNFARNLYWVEFTWFIPMMIGLICLLHIDSGKWRKGCYVAAFIAIAGKSLCGYEYISVVMMGLIAFILMELLLAIVKKDKQRTKLLFGTTFILGVCALAGFMLAICIHALLKGDGNMVEGIKRIILDDVLRRTSGANLNNIVNELWPSMNASVWEVFCKYFHFSTEIVTGIAGNLFPMLCLTPIGIFIYEFKKNKIDFQSIFMYIIFFFTSISWFCLAKSHSYVHTHMNYVLWYFGFVQTCFYVIVSRIISAVSEKRKL